MVTGIYLAAVGLNAKPFRMTAIARGLYSHGLPVNHPHQRDRRSPFQDIDSKYSVTLSSPQGNRCHGSRQAQEARQQHQ